MEFAELIVVGAGALDWIGDFLTDVDRLVKTALALVGVVVAVLIIAKNPSLGRTISGLVVGAFIWGLPYLVPLVGDMFRSDVSSAPPAVQQALAQDITPSSQLDPSK